MAPYTANLHYREIMEASNPWDGAIEKLETVPENPDVDRSYVETYNAIMDAVDRVLSENPPGERKDQVVEMYEERPRLFTSY